MNEFKIMVGNITCKAKLNKNKTINFKMTYKVPKVPVERAIEIRFRNWEEMNSFINYLIDLETAIWLKLFKEKLN